MTGKLKAAAALFLIAVVMAASFGAYKHKQANTREALLEKAESLAAEGSYADAVRTIDKALESADDGNCSDEALHLKKAQYLQEAGDTDQALSEAMRVVKNTQEGQPEYDEAWERIVSICTQEEEYGKLATLLEGSGVESIKSRYYNYLVYDPVFRDPPGTYEGSLEDWAFVTKESNWDGNAGEMNGLDKVQCLDGYMEYDDETGEWKVGEE